MFEMLLPKVGVPIYHAEDANCEAFLYARLTYAGARIIGLPAMAYVQCTPSHDLSNLRTLGYASCTSFSELFLEWEGRLAGMFGGMKYPQEFYSIVVTDNVLRGLYIYNFNRIPGDQWIERIKRLFGFGRAPIEWTR